VLNSAEAARIDLERAKPYEVFRRDLLWS